MVCVSDCTGAVVKYAYNSIGQSVSEHHKINDDTEQVFIYHYDAPGRLAELKQSADEKGCGHKTLSIWYEYDHNGNWTEKHQIGGITRYTYDTLNQLTKVQYPSYTEELSYDRAGNRVRRKTDKVEELYSYAPRNRLIEYTKGGEKTQFTYDNVGNLLKGNKAKYTYDVFNHTEKVETFDDHVQINRYDVEGLRHEMEEDGRLVQFIFSGDEIVAEEKDNNIIQFIRGYELIASDAESARTYYHYACPNSFNCC